VHQPPRIRVAALVVQDDRIMLIRHEKEGRHYWLLPGGGVEPGETLDAALRRELREECGLASPSVGGPVALAESIAPNHVPGGRHIVHLVFAVEVTRGALALVTSRDRAVRNHALVARSDLTDLDVRPPIQRFLARYQPGDPFMALGASWTP
jgi:8-oxo-dGTP diphosphatase